MENILFSILVPVYNVEKYLEECIDSILNQTYKNFELILVDDGSTDKSSEICDFYLKKDQRVKVYHQKNMGGVISRINALKYAVGDFIYFIDSDDFIEKDLLKEVYLKIIEKNSDLVLFKYNKVDITGRKILELDDFFKEKIVDKKLFWKKLVEHSELNSLAIKIVKREKMKVNKLEKLPALCKGQDLLITLSFLDEIDSIIYLNKTFYNYRNVSNSIVNTFKYKQFYDLTILYYEIIEKNLLYGTSKTLELIYKDYLKMIAIYIYNLSKSKNLNKKDKMKILKDIKQEKLYLKSLSYLNKTSLREKVLILLFSNLNNNIFLNVVNFFKIIKNLKKGEGK